MSYARFSDGDVYVFFSVDSELECCGCQLQQREWVDDPTWPLFGGYFREVGERVEQVFASTHEMVDHLALHRAAGHDVPDRLEDALLKDDEANFGSGAVEP